MPAGPGSPRRWRSLLANVLLSLAVTAALVALLEGGARLFAPERPPVAVADYIWDWQTKWDGEFYTIHSDGVGWPPWEEINGDGVRDRTHAPEKPEGTLRLVFLGDSVTLGAGIKPAEAFPQVLQSRLDAEGRPVEVFNVALWGWSTRQERLAYERIARRYRPDAVVLAVCLNDLPELQNNLVRPPGLIAALHERSAFVRWVVDAPGREIRSVEELFGRKDSARVRQAFARFFDEVRALRREVEADGAGLSLLVFPFRFQVEPGAPPPTAQEEIASFAAAEGIPCLDLLPALRGLGTLAFLDYDHLSAAGARTAADVIRDGGLVPDAPSAREVLGERAGAPVRAPSDPEPAVRRAAAWLLGREPGPDTAARLAEVLGRDPAESVRAEAARSLGALGDGDDDAGRPAVPALFDALRDVRQGVRWAAADALHALGPAAPADVPRLAAALASDDAYVRGFAAWTLGNLGPAAREAVPALVAVLGEDDAYGRAGAATALAKMGAAAREAVPALIRGLRSGDPDRRWKAARALGRIGPDSREAVPVLIDALADPNVHVRVHSARALGRIGPAARSAAAALTRLGKDPVEDVRREAAEALARIAAAS
jgi:HEAT repeat protein/lysophospholipase L1-like esterase